MKKLFLTSSFGDVADRIRQRTNCELRGKIVAFIPTASIVEERTDYVSTAAEIFQEWGMEIVYLDVSGETREAGFKILQRADFIYVSGGNSFYLLQELRKKKLDEGILQAITVGKIYIGESAGSIIMAPDIQYISAMDDKNKGAELDSFTGLNQLSSYPLPHLNNPYLEHEVKKIMAAYKEQLPLLPITDHQLIIVEGDQLSIV